MDDLTEVNIHIGKIALATETQRLQALLGSCVGIAMIHRRRNMCTLCHCLLPFNPEPTEDIVARWVDSAVYSSLKLLEISPGYTRHLEAVIAGGGNTVSGLQTKKVGEANANAARKVLGDLRIHILEDDTGGEFGRRISIRGDTLEHAITVIPKNENEVA